MLAQTKHSRHSERWTKGKLITAVQTNWRRMRFTSRLKSAMKSLQVEVKGKGYFTAFNSARVSMLTRVDIGDESTWIKTLF